MVEKPPIIAICGKGGVGKTVVTTLIARAIINQGERLPLLLVDADPVMGLSAAVGHTPTMTLGLVRDRVVETLREVDIGKDQVASSLDYWLLEALNEGESYALLVMGRSLSQGAGCFCPINTLLRQAIDLVAAPFASVLIDAEAGIEQVQREVTRRVTTAFVVIDGSWRALDTLVTLRDMLPQEISVLAVANRWRSDDVDPELPQGVSLIAKIPEDDELREFDRAGRSLWELQEKNPAVVAASEIARFLGEGRLP